jgi:hypothetical protein
MENKNSTVEKRITCLREFYCFSKLKKHLMKKHTHPFPQVMYTTVYYTQQSKFEETNIMPDLNNIDAMDQDDGAHNSGQQASNSQLNFCADLLDFFLKFALALHSISQY